MSADETPVCQVPELGDWRWMDRQAAPYELVEITVEGWQTWRIVAGWPR